MSQDKKEFLAKVFAILHESEKMRKENYEEVGDSWRMVSLFRNLEEYGARDFSRLLQQLNALRDSPLEERISRIYSYLVKNQMVTRARPPTLKSILKLARTVNPLSDMETLDEEMEESYDNERNRLEEEKTRKELKITVDQPTNVSEILDPIEVENRVSKVQELPKKKKNVTSLVAGAGIVLMFVLTSIGSLFPSSPHPTPLPRGERESIAELGL